LSPVGNVAAAACDTWSNESVQNIKLLGAMAPVCSIEQLVYDCRLFNRALADGGALQLQKWLIDSDAALDPQAFILTPVAALRVAAAIVAAPNAYAAGCAAGLTAVAVLKEAYATGQLKLPPREVAMLDIIQDSIAELPATESAFIDLMMGQIDQSKFVARDYGL